MGSLTQGALRGYAASRPWALECNAFGVKTAILFDIDMPHITLSPDVRGDASGNASKTAFGDFQNTV